jgi:hypothetical protein
MVGGLAQAAGFCRYIRIDIALPTQAHTTVQPDIAALLSQRSTQTRSAGARCSTKDERRDVCGASSVAHHATWDSAKFGVQLKSSLQRHAKSIQREGEHTRRRIVCHVSLSETRTSGWSKRVAHVLGMVRSIVSAPTIRAMSSVHGISRMSQLSRTVNCPHRSSALLSVVVLDLHAFS